uniref:TF-B3 domain-containing protein n=1 Tax=Aegilops tauschii subsp. strangulata TaxID=200361 RepID=A0A453M360_AEGTS
MKLLFALTTYPPDVFVFLLCCFSLLTPKTYPSDDSPALCQLVFLFFYLMCRMVCTICHSHCESDNEQTFRIVIRDDYEALANIPCTERNMFNQMSGLNYKADDRRYVFDVYRGHEATLIGGDDWTKFKRDFDVGQGNVVVFDMTGEQQRYMWLELRLKKREELLKKLLQLMKRKRLSMMITGLKMH